MKELEQAAKEFFRNIECTTPEESFIAGANWQSEQDNWILYSERLPEEGQIIDVWNTISNLRAQFINKRFQRYIDVSDKDRVCVLIYTKVTHWQPLPKKPLNKGK